MIVFRFWSRFGAYKDPLGISQNITFALPPKTAIGGMMGAVLGKTPKEIFADEDYFDFGYSNVLLRPARKQSFAQNYIDDYTKSAATKLDEMKKLRAGNPKSRWAKLHQEGFKKGAKPIFRELLINPDYLIAIDNFKYEEELHRHMDSHYSAYPVYMGNSEFAANFALIEHKAEQVSSDRIDSFTTQVESIDFQADQHYTSMKLANRSYGEREYRDYLHIIVSNRAIKLQSDVSITKISTALGEYQCEFI